MRPSKLLTFAFLSVVAFLSCSAPCIIGEGEVITEKRNLQAFDGIELRCSMDVQFRASRNARNGFIVLQAQENLMPYIKTEVKDGILIIDLENCVNTTEELTAQIGVADLKKIINKGSGNIYTQTGIPFEEMVVVNDGSGEIDLKLKGGPIWVENDGSGPIYIEGVATELNVENDGSGDVDLSNLQAQDVEVVNDGSGNVTVWTENTIEIVLKGSGNVSYSGRPISVSEENKGSGEIIRTDK